MQVQIPCICPPREGGEQRHPSGDTVNLKPVLGFREAATIRNAIVIAKSEDDDVSVAEVLALLTEHYLLMGVESWSLVDDKGKPVPVSKPAIRELLLPNIEVAMDLGNAADELYSQAVMRPLTGTAQTSSPPMPTSDSISPRTGSTDEASMPSKPSLTTTSQTDATEMTSRSLAGVSS